MTSVMVAAIVISGFCVITWMICNSISNYCSSDKENTELKIKLFKMEKGFTEQETKK